MAMPLGVGGIPGGTTKLSDNGSQTSVAISLPVSEQFG